MKHPDKIKADQYRIRSRVALLAVEGYEQEAQKESGEVKAAMLALAEAQRKLSQALESEANRLEPK